MITNKGMDNVFAALANETRRTILDCLKDHPGLPVGKLAKHFDVSRIAVMNHLAVLEEAGLVTSVREGRTRHLYLNLAPIQMIHDRWSDEYSGYWAGRMTSIKYAAEEAARKKEQGNE